MPAFAILALLALRAPNGDDYSQLWDKVSGRIEARYYARRTRKADMDRLFAKYGPIARSAKSRDEFSKALNDMIAEFGDSHFAFLPDDEQGYYVMDSLARQKEAQTMPNIGAWFRRDKDGYTVQMLLEGSPAAEAGIRKGDVVVSADGKPFAPIASLSKHDHVHLLLRRRGQTLEKDVKVREATGSDMFLQATRDSVRVIPFGGKKIGYIHLWTCANDQFRSVLAEAVRGPLSDTDGIVFDIRDGFGGRPEGFAEPFLEPKAQAGQPSHWYGKPLVLLINRGSRSAKELLSYNLKKSHRATLVGENTAGNVLGTFPERIEDWAYIEIPLVDIKVGGGRLEGQGVAPDVAVPQEFDPSGKDLFLQRALETLVPTKG